MPTTCDINFENNPEKVYYAGQLLRGTIKLTLTSAKTVRGVYIVISGRAYCHWTTGSGKNRKSHTGNEDYLEEKTYLYGDENGENIGFFFIMILIIIFCVEFEVMHFF